MSGYVYAIKHPDGYMKIGRSGSPEERCRTLQAGSPYDLWVAAKVPVHDPARVEAEIHSYFEEKRVRGEWFDFDGVNYGNFERMARAVDAGISPGSIPEFGPLQLEMVIGGDRNLRGEPQPLQND